MKYKFSKMQSLVAMYVNPKLLISTAAIILCSSAVNAQAADPFAGLPPGALPGEQAPAPSGPENYIPLDPANAEFNNGLPAGGFGLPTAQDAVPVNEPAVQPTMQPALPPQTTPNVNLGQPIGASLNFFTPSGELPLQKTTKSELASSTDGVPRYYLYSQTGQYDSQFAKCNLENSDGIATYSCNHDLYGDFYLHARNVNDEVEFYHSQSATAGFGLDLASSLEGGLDAEEEEKGGFLSRFGFLGGGASSSLDSDAQKKFRFYVAARGIGSMGTSFTNDLVDTSITPNQTYTATTETGFGYGASVAGGARYRLGFVALRGEAEAAFKTTGVSGLSKSNGYASADASGSVSMMSAMLNGMVEFMPDSKINPYIGAGAGLTNFKFDFQENNTSYVDTSASALTYQALVGAKYNINNKLSVFGEYRFVTAPGVDLNDASGGITSQSYSNNEFAVGVAYHF